MLNNQQPRRGLALIAGFSLLFALGGCGESEPPSQTPPATEQTTDAGADAADSGTTELFPRQAFFGNPTKFQGRISPDGQWLSWLAPRDGVMNIWVAPADDPGSAVPVTADTGRGIPVHYWSPDSERLLYTQDKGGNENHHVYSVSRNGGEAVDLTPVADDVRAIIMAISRDRPKTVLVGLNERNPQLFDLYEINIATGERTLSAENPGYAGWEVDHELKPRLGWRTQPDGSRDLVRLDEEGETQLARFGPQDVMTSGVISFDGSNRYAYLIDSRDRDLAALMRLDVSTGETTLVAEAEDADISDVLIDPVTRNIRAVATEHLRVQWQGLDDEARATLADITAQIEGDLSFVTASADGQMLVIASTTATRSTVYHLYDRKAGKAAEMFVSRAALADAQLREMHPTVIASRDGLSLVSYLTLPAGSDENGDGVPEAPVPMVLYVHGGPWARDSYGYNTVHQWLSDRGYAVLSVNYRGSTGFGKAFINAAKGEFAGKMHDDLIDAVRWAVDEGVTTAEQVAIMGGSYGGYATLVGVTFTPDTFACGVDIVGPSSLITLIESFPDYWRPSLESNWYAFVGDPADEEARADMINRSPISRVADIKVPLLIGQGENDPRVTKAESDQIVDAMRTRNLPVTYLNYPDEGHGFARPENRMSFFATTEAFLSKCLGGRYEPIGDDFEGSSVQVLHGAEYVPGLGE